MILLDNPIQVATWDALGVFRFYWQKYPALVS